MQMIHSSLCLSAQLLVWFDQAFVVFFIANKTEFILIGSNPQSPELVLFFFFYDLIIVYRTNQSNSVVLPSCRVKSLGVILSSSVPTSVLQLT